MGPIYIETLYINSHVGPIYIETPYIIYNSFQHQPFIAVTSKIPLQQYKAKTSATLIIYPCQFKLYVMGPLPTHLWTLPNSILIESQVLSKSLDTLPIFDWQVSLAYTTTFLWILLLQYIFKPIPCSELSFRGPKLGPHHFIRKYLTENFVYLATVEKWTNIRQDSNWNKIKVL